MTPSDNSDGAFSRQRPGEGSQPPELVLEARRVTKSYGADEARVEALRGVDFTARRGEFVAIMGPSGSGKSTLLHLLGGLDAPTSGQILLEGTDIGSLDDKARTLIRRRRLGFIFQKLNLIPTLTAEENVALVLQLDGVAASEANRRAKEMLAVVGLSARRTHVPSHLSGGEQQRVAIARSLSASPAVLLADEPTGSLDSVNGAQIIDLLRQFSREHSQTIIVVTHDASVAAQADRIVRLRDGLIQSEERPTAPTPPVNVPLSKAPQTS